MGILLHNGATIVLDARHLIGRSRSMDSTLSAPDVSGEHLVLVWRGERWYARDLGSRNGSRLNGQPLVPGNEVALATGDTLALGLEPHVFRVGSVAPPGPVAWSGETFVEGEVEWLALPDPEQPDVLIQADPELGWTWETGHERRRIGSGEVVRAGGRSWTLRLPEAIESTLSRPEGTTPEELGLRFRVSLDEEHVELDLVRDGGVVSLRPRAHHYVLLVLARLRLDDQQRGLPLVEQGWVGVDDLARMLRCPMNHVHVSVHRARKELAGLGVQDAQALVELRPGSRTLRLGVGDLAVASLT